LTPLPELLPAETRLLIVAFNRYIAAAGDDSRQKRGQRRFPIS
jgi:hypothetical protein